MREAFCLNRRELAGAEVVLYILGTKGPPPVTVHLKVGVPEKWL